MSRRGTPVRPRRRPPRPARLRRTVEHMADTQAQACVGRGDGSDCPDGEDQVLVDGVRCEECRHYWELDQTEPARRLPADDGLTRPAGDPRETGHGTPV